MKQRTTLTLDPGISHRAKQLARQRGVSLSSMVEGLLATETSADSAGLGSPGFSARWKGKGKLAEKAGEPRFERLSRKYGIGESGR